MIVTVSNLFYKNHTGPEKRRGLRSRQSAISLSDCESCGARSLCFDDARLPAHHYLQYLWIANLEV